MSISKEHGFIFGDRDHYKMDVKILCSNDTTEEHVCVQLVMNMEMHLELSMQDLFFKPRLQDMIVRNTQIKRDLINLADESFQEKFDGLLVKHTQAFNEVYEKPVQIGKIFPEL